MARWQAMQTAPRDRDFLAQLEDGYVTRARFKNDLVVADSHPWEAHAIFKAIGWQEVPTARKRKGNVRSNDYTPEFLAFYAGFPGRKGESKLDAFKAWRALGPVLQEQANKAKPIYVAICSRKDPDFFPATGVWLRQRRFETLLAESNVPSAGFAQPDATPQDWEKRVSLYRRTSNWNPAFGPPPGSPGCMVPTQVLADSGLFGVD